MKGLQKIQKQMAGNQDLPIAHDFGILPALYPQHTYCRHKGWYLLLHVNRQIAKGTWQQNQQPDLFQQSNLESKYQLVFHKNQEGEKAFLWLAPRQQHYKSQSTTKLYLLPINFMVLVISYVSISSTPWFSCFYVRFLKNNYVECLSATGFPNVCCTTFGAVFPVNMVLWFLDWLLWCKFAKFLFKSCPFAENNVNTFFLKFP